MGGDGRHDNSMAELLRRIATRCVGGMGESATGKKNTSVIQVCVFLHLCMPVIHNSCAINQAVNPPEIQSHMD